MGVILNLALWFAVHFLFAQTAPSAIGPDLPVWSSVNPWALILSVAAAVALFRFKLNVFAILGGCAAVGLIIGLI